MGLFCVGELVDVDRDLMPASLVAEAKRDDARAGTRRAVRDARIAARRIVGMGVDAEDGGEVVDEELSFGRVAARYRARQGSLGTGLIELYFYIMSSRGFIEER